VSTIDWNILFFAQLLALFSFFNNLLKMLKFLANSYLLTDLLSFQTCFSYRKDCGEKPLEVFERLLVFSNL